MMRKRPLWLRATLPPAAITPVPTASALLSKPRVSAPKRKGFGTIVVESQVAATFRGKVDMDYAPGGFVWTLQAPSSLLRWERAAVEDETRQAR